MTIIDFWCLSCASHVVCFKLLSGNDNYWESNQLLKNDHTFYKVLHYWAEVVALLQSTGLQSKTLGVVGSILARCWACFLLFPSLSSVSWITEIRCLALQLGRNKHNIHRFGNKYVNKNRLLHHDTKVVTINLSTIIIFSSRPSLEKENAIVVIGNRYRQ